jgi:hypothetical protein
MTNIQRGGPDDNLVPIRGSSRPDKENPMWKIALLTALAMGGMMAHAKKDCTDQPKEKWMKEEDFKKKMEAEGYKIRKFKQSGNCYEIYGTNSQGQDVEIYFDPVDGKIKKEKKK